MDHESACLATITFRVAGFGNRKWLVEYVPGPQACRNGIDNDGDSLVDFAGGDPDCSQPNDPSEDNFDLILPLTYIPGLDDEVIFDSRNNREWLRWDQLIVSGPGAQTYADVIDAIATGAYSGQGWSMGRNADGLAFVDARSRFNPGTD